MMNKTKRSIVSLVLALVMILGLMPSMAARAEGETGTIYFGMTVKQDGINVPPETAAGTTVTVKDAGGNEVLNYTETGDAFAEIPAASEGTYTVTVTPAVIDGYTAEVEGAGTVDVTFYEDDDELCGDLNITIKYVKAGDEGPKDGSVTFHVNAVDENGNAADIPQDVKIVVESLVGDKTVTLTGNDLVGGNATITLQYTAPRTEYGYTVYNGEEVVDSHRFALSGTTPAEEFDVKITVAAEEPAPADESKADEPADDSKTEEPTEEPKEDESKAEEPAEDSKTEEPTEEPKEDESKAKEPAEDSKTEEPTEEPKEDESKAEEEQKPAEPKKTVDELAQEVLDGKWGANEERKQRLTEAGYDYYAVQERVNQLVAERDAKAEESKKDDYTETSGNEGQTKPPTEESSRTTNRSEDQPNTGDFGMVWFMVVGIAVAAIAVLARSRKAARN